MAAVLFWLAIAFILYTYAGYPIIIALAARFVRAKTYSWAELPSVTLLIPAYNEESVIGRKIENSLELDYPPEKLQILVAADGSDDDTPEIVESYKERGIVLNYLPERAGKMAAINRAVPECTGEIIVFSDANNIYLADTIKKLVQPFADQKVGVTTGSKRIIQDERELSSAEGLYWKYESAIKENETRLGSCVAAVGEILAVRKKIFVPAPKNIINDDRYLVMNLLKRGYHVVYVPDAMSYEHVSLSAKDEIKRRKRMNAGGFQAIFLSKELLPFNRPLEIWKILSHKYCRAFIPFGLIIAYLTNFFLLFFPLQGARYQFWSLAFPYNWILFIFQNLFYVIGLLGNIFKIPGKFGKLIYLPTFLINSNFAVLRGLISYLSDKDIHLWEKVNRIEIS